jgi:hypothetical protein
MSSAPSTSSSSSAAKIEIVSVGKVKKEMELKKTWARELMILERVFKYLMFDMFFRMCTFNRLRFSKKDVKSLAEQGFFNARIVSGNYKDYKLICVFCNFEFSSCDHQELNVTNAYFQHNIFNSECSIFRAHRGLRFTKPLDLLGLTNVGMKYFVSNKNQIRAVKPLYLDTMCKPNPKGQDRLRCDSCFENIKNVLTSCNHISICSECFTSDKNPNETRCIVCRQSFDFYCKVNLPEPTFGFSQDLNNLFERSIDQGDQDQQGQNDNSDLRAFMQLIAGAGIRVTYNRTRQQQSN